MKIKKIAILVMCAALLVAGSALATFAFLSDEEGVVNTFTVGKVYVDLDEAAVDEYGVPIEGADRVYENDYKLIPGWSYTKDPTMTILEDSESAYVRMMVTLTGYSQLEAAFGDGFSVEDIVNIGDQWTCVNETENTLDDTLVCEFRYASVVDGLNGALTLQPLFTTLTMPEEISSEDLANIAGSFDMQIVGHAMQAKGFADADAAWEAFEK